MTLILTTGPKLFDFVSLDEWSNCARYLFGDFYATTGLGLHDTLAVDRAGRVCSCGRDYMRADREGTYPITVYAIDPNSAPRPSPEPSPAEVSR